MLPPILWVLSALYICPKILGKWHQQIDTVTIALKEIAKFNFSLALTANERERMKHCALLRADLCLSIYVRLALMFWAAVPCSFPRDADRCRRPAYSQSMASSLLHNEHYFNERISPRQRRGRLIKYPNLWNDSTDGRRSQERGVARVSQKLKRH